MSAYLRIVSGTDRKVEFPLNPSIENLIGRGRECHMQLEDPRASRIHARVLFQEDKWLIVDSGSMNGISVNGSKTDSALLIDGVKVCIGDTELVFTDSGLRESVTREQISVEIPLVPAKSGNMPFSDPESKEAGLKAFEALREGGLDRELTALHEFNLKSNALSNEKELVELTIDLLSRNSKADAVAFLLANDIGKLDVAGMKSSAPDYSPQISQQLNELVTNKLRAVWLQQETESVGKSVNFADAICVPLVDEDKSLGALHLYNKDRKFARSNFDFLIAVASIVGVALVRVLSAQSIQAELGRLQIKNADFDELIGSSPLMADLKDRICRISRASGCILVRGESGSGKELVARAIHRNSPRSSRPMLSVNCAAIPDELMESQLFGHVKGAFTGADRDHVGYFQQANKGTLFLDEVGELNLEGQAKLLRILEGHPFLPVGATQEVKVDVRVVSATNRDLREFVANRRFREDLYYRLSVFEVYIPPLRDRGPDIDLLVEFFLNHFKKQNGRKHLKISQKAMEALRSYNWPGNVRQLRNVIDSAVVLADGAEILTKDLSLRDVSMPGPQLDRKTRIDMPSEDRNLRPVLGDFPNNDSQASTVIIRKKPNQGDEADQSNHSQTSPPAPTPVVMKSDFDTLNVEVWELRLIQEAMRRTGGNIQVAAELLGISRATLYRKLEKGNLNPNPDQASP